MENFSKFGKKIFYLIGNYLLARSVQMWSLGKSLRSDLCALVGLELWYYVLFGVNKLRFS